jgi:hypothetical protein
MLLHGAGERGDERGVIALGGVKLDPGMRGPGELPPGGRVGASGLGLEGECRGLSGCSLVGEGGVPAGWGPVTRGEQRLGLPLDLGRKWGREGWVGLVESERACISSLVDVPPVVDLDV